MNYRWFITGQTGAGEYLEDCPYNYVPSGGCSMLHCSQCIFDIKATCPRFVEDSQPFPNKRDYPSVQAFVEEYLTKQLLT